MYQVPKEEMKAARNALNYLGDTIKGMVALYATAEVVRKKLGIPENGIRVRELSRRPLSAIIQDKAGAFSVEIFEYSEKTVDAHTEPAIETAQISEPVYGVMLWGTYSVPQFSYTPNSWLRAILRGRTKEVARAQLDEFKEATSKIIRDRTGRELVIEDEGIGERVYGLGVHSKVKLP